MKIQDYSLEVTNFPSTITDENVIGDHFKSLGLDVKEVKLARNYHDCLSKFQKTVEMKKQLRLEQAKKQLDPYLNNGKKISRLNNEILVLQKKI